MADEVIDYAPAYRALRARVAQLVLAAGDDQLDAPAPATPEWCSRDLLAHLTGVTADIIAANIEGVTTDPWTQAQVDARRGKPVAEVVAEWDANSEQVEPLIPSFGVMAGQFIFDAVTHEHDIRGALGAPGARGSDAVEISVAWLGDRVGEMRDGAGVGALQVHCEDGTRVFGNGPPSASCRTTRFELVRATTGRRSVGQMVAWDWDGDPRVDLLVMPIFTPRAESLAE